MAARFYGWAWAQPVRGSTQHVLLYLADKADQAGQCWPSTRTIADATGISIRTVKRRLDDLQRAGLIVRQRRHRSSDGTRTSDLITLSLGVTVAPRDGGAKVPKTTSLGAKNDVPRCHSGTADPRSDPRSESVVLTRAGANGKAEHDPDAWMRRPGQRPAPWFQSAADRGGKPLPGTDANVAAHLALAEQLHDGPPF